MTPISTPSNEQSNTHLAHQHLEALSAAMDSGTLAKTPVLIRLQTALSEAIEAYKLSQQPASFEQSFEQQLEQQAHLSWLCNQCKYYLSQSIVVEAQPRKHRSLRHLRAILIAIARFRVIVHLRSLFPGRAPTTLEWRDILPGLKLWFR